MPNLESIQQIVDNNLHSASPAVRTAGEKIFSMFLTNSGVETGTICNTIRMKIQEALTKKDRKEAYQILAKIKEQILTASLDAGLQDHGKRKSAERMKRETLRTYEVIHVNGRGVVYLGSARSKPGDKIYESAKELGREVYKLLGSTSWSGAGPGQMEAPLMGAKDAGGKVAGIKIRLNGDNTKFEQEINDALNADSVAECDFFGPRKIGLADAAMRIHENDRTAIIATPGGFGTRDEFYEYIVLKQLRKLGSDHDVPILLVNSDHSFEHLINDIDMMLRRGLISKKDLDLFYIANNNRMALDYLASFYDIPQTERKYMQSNLQF